MIKRILTYSLAASLVSGCGEESKLPENNVIECRGDQIKEYNHVSGEEECIDDIFEEVVPERMADQPCQNSPLVNKYLKNIGTCREGAITTARGESRFSEACQFDLLINRLSGDLLENRMKQQGNKVYFLYPIKGHALLLTREIYPSDLAQHPDCLGPSAIPEYECLFAERPNVFVAREYASHFPESKDGKICLSEKNLLLIDDEPFLGTGSCKRREERIESSCNVPREF